jgi:phosphatidylglycerol:prolipoprotein diacylglycerol transferase
MDPVAFSIGNLEIRWYGILMSLGILVATLLTVHFAKKDGVKEDDVYDLAIWMIPAGIIFARLYYVVFEWDYYSANPSQILNFRGGGLAIHGAVIGGALAGYVRMRMKNINFLQFADFVAPGLILAQAIGRWGNFANGEAHGGPTDLPWGIMVDGVKVHPTFLYESIWNFLVFIFLIFMSKRKKFNGQLFFLYGILYSVARFYIEGLRTDSLYFGPIRMAQFVSLVTIIGFSILYYFFNKRQKQKNSI